MTAFRNVNRAGAAHSFKIVMVALTGAAASAPAVAAGPEFWVDGAMSVSGLDAVQYRPPPFSSPALYSDLLTNSYDATSCAASVSRFAGPGVVIATGYGEVFTAPYDGDLSSSGGAVTYSWNTFGAKFVADDLVISDPANPGAVVWAPFSANLMVVADAQAEGFNNCSARYNESAAVAFRASFGVAAAFLDGAMGRKNSVFPLDDYNTGGLATVAPGQTALLTTSVGGANTNTPTSISIEVAQGADIVICAPDPHVRHGRPHSGIELWLPSSGPVLNLPPGYTANSAQAHIVDNHWVGAAECAPSVSDGPDAVQIGVGAPAQFSIGASGLGTLAYQWRRDGAPLSDGGGVSGATAPTLVIAAAGPGDAGQYDCVVTNACGSATSDPAGLTLTPACPGDIDGSGAVGLADISVLIQNWGSSVPPAPLAADLDGSGDIGLGDIAVVVQHWGQTCP